MDLLAVSRKNGYGVPSANLVGDAGRGIFWVVFCEEGCAEFSNTRNPSYERILSDFHIQTCPQKIVAPGLARNMLKNGFGVVT